MTHLTLHEEIYKTRIEYQKMKAERDTLIDDIAVLKVNISRLERENVKLKRENKRLIKKNNKVIATSLELDKYRGNYITLTNHIRMKAEHNPGVSRYIDLVNYIDRLEQK
ncbi:hypothetical protein BU110_00590 [Staphylococcus shinii]|uniref:hypothetical protein n=1 Tax=Staphylococcus shinii TaxID=2912228 RepID=UPI000D1F7FEA|nr:hypothetical protein [Staphylococcus shinii]PTI68085.1 hypothetical protein BU110_00590 [Staphylococcus shinii]